MSDLAWLVKTSLLGTMVIAKKDIRLYYVKGPVIIFGLLFPLFLFLAFSVGRGLSGPMFAAPMLAMAVFFTSSSVGPIIAPWETRMRTLEKLLTTPIPVASVVIGGILAGFVFGVAVSSLAFVIAVLVLAIDISAPLMLFSSILLASLCFSSLGILLSFPPTDNPSNVMMLANLVKLPLIFVSGVFVSLAETSGWARYIAMFSPLSYFADVARGAMGQTTVHHPSLNIIALGAFTVLLLLLAILLHEKNMWKRL